MVHTYAKVVGLALFLLGLLGGIPLFAPQGLLFGIFRVDFIHNLLHLVSGLILMGVGFGVHWGVARRIVLLFALIYGFLTVLGFLAPDGRVLGMAVNMADNVLHLTVTATALMFALPVRHYTSRKSRL
ncbi:DUF4383 domain-containing protein [Vampirovibrio sp.]|uniref:DUF4383 domain-containing protein n=1 Tax=Vampirovibrio sp. TaxID=2717857 RepID=UPI0035937102